jgi:hypothetical protein
MTQFNWTRKKPLLRNTPSFIDLKVSVRGIPIDYNKILILKDDLEVLGIFPRSPSPDPSTEPAPELDHQPQSSLSNDAMNTIRMMLEQVRTEPSNRHIDTNVICYLDSSPICPAAGSNSSSISSDSGSGATYAAAEPSCSCSASEPTQQ